MKTQTLLTLLIFATILGVFGCVDHGPEQRAQRMEKNIDAQRGAMGNHPAPVVGPQTKVTNGN